MIIKQTILIAINNNTTSNSSNNNDDNIGRRRGRPGGAARANGEPGGRGARGYTRSPLEVSRLFGPSPWKILTATYEENDF